MFEARSAWERDVTIHLTYTPTMQSWGSLIEHTIPKIVYSDLSLPLSHTLSLHPLPSFREIWPRTFPFRSMPCVRDVHTYASICINPPLPYGG